MFLGQNMKSIKKYMVGSCKHADISVFSFHPVKTITTAEEVCWLQTAKN